MQAALAPASHKPGIQPGAPINGVNRVAASPVAARGVSESYLISRHARDVPQHQAAYSGRVKPGETSHPDGRATCPTSDCF